MVYNDMVCLTSNHKKVFFQNLQQTISALILFIILFIGVKLFEFHYIINTNHKLSDDMCV